MGSSNAYPGPAHRGAQRASVHVRMSAGLSAPLSTVVNTAIGYRIGYPRSRRRMNDDGETSLTCGNGSGAEGTRTPDPLHAMQVRYQLRHSPGNAASLAAGADRPKISAA
jgi:hypothetical protein